MPNTTPTPALLDVMGPIATITINRPDKHNALNFDVIDRIQDYLDLVESEMSIRVVILTGTGERAFSAGADIRELRETLRRGVDTAMREFVRRGQALTRRIESFPKPVIAAVNGLAYGGGCEVVEACPLAVAASHAAFSKPEIRLGFAPPFGGTQRLPRLIGRKRALGMILTGDVIGAQEAQRIGLVNEVVPAQELLSAAQALAGRIIVHTPDAVRSCLASVTRGVNLTIDEGLAVEASHFEHMAATSDVHDGLQRFLSRPRGQENGSLFKEFLQPVAEKG